MKLFTKIFICAVTVVTLALAVLGYVMISGSFSNALEREKNNCLDRYQLLKFAVQSAMLSESEKGALTDEKLLDAADRAFEAVSGSDKAALLNENGEAVRSNFAQDCSFASAMTVNVDDIMSVTENWGGTMRHTVSGKFTEGGRTVVLVYSRNISAVYEEKHGMERRFFTAYVIAESIAAAVMATLSFFITAPINRLTRSTRRFAEGRFEERTRASGGGEIGELSESFNVMAETIEKNIADLKLSAKQKDDFTASFAHELKTPLTSVIGYADMIYQRGELDRKEVKEAAGYIVSEGMRLEALSLKLMELIVLDKHEFTLVEMDAAEVLSDISETMKPAAAKKNAELTAEAEKAYIRIEFDLFKTLVMNLIDNALKADGKTVRLTGRRTDGGYRIEVSDDGRGIPEDQLERITEAFYMVDKSRSRREHGAGLGLAIASRIADIHGTKLEFESKLGEGTKVGFVLKTNAGALPANTETEEEER